MPSPPAKIYVATSGTAGLFRIRGRATATESSGFKTAAEGLRLQGTRHFVIDLTECQSMDSTFIGVLAGLSRRLKEAAGKDAKVELVNPGETVHQQLDNLFVLDQFTLTQCQLEPGTPYEAVEAGGVSKAELCRLMLDAHQTLMQVHAGNVPKFKQVTDFLQEDLRKLE